MKLLTGGSYCLAGARKPGQRNACSARARADIRGVIVAWRVAAVGRVRRAPWRTPRDHLQATAIPGRARARRFPLPLLWRGKQRRARAAGYACQSYPRRAEGRAGLRLHLGARARGFIHKLTHMSRTSSNPVILALTSRGVWRSHPAARSNSSNFLGMVAPVPTRPYGWSVSSVPTFGEKYTDETRWGRRASRRWQIAEHDRANAL